MAKTQNRVLAWVLSLALALTLLPVNALAEGDTELEHLPGGCVCQCEHEHDVAVCGYVKATEGSPCTHVHDEDCGYEEGVEGSCTHTHDGTCGYAEAVEGVSCNHDCAAEGCKRVCVDGCPVAAAKAKAEADQAAADAVIALINNLPEADELTDMDDETAAAIGEASDAYDALSDDQKALVTNYGKLEALLDILTPEVEPIDGTDTEEMPQTAVAQITSEDGELTQYTTLDKAIEDASDGDTIELLADCTLSANNGIKITSNITICGTGNETITVTADRLPGDRMIEIKTESIESGLTLKDCNVYISNIPTSNYAYNAVIIINGGKLVLDNCDMTLDGIQNDGTYNNMHGFWCLESGDNLLSVINGSNLLIQNFKHNALEWDGTTDYYFEVKNSSFKAFNTRGGIIGTWNVTFDHADVQVCNSSGNGSNGPHFIIKNSEVDFSNNGSHGLSAGNLTIEDSTVTAINNGYCGIVVGNKFEASGNTEITVTGNAKKEDVGYAGFRLYGNCDHTIGEDCVVKINDNFNTGLYVRKGSLTVADGAQLQITGNTVTNTLMDGYGGGVYVGYSTYDDVGDIVLPADAEIYNNHSLNGGDDIYVAPGNGAVPTISFGEVGDDWYLDGDPDCEDKITGWFDDSEGDRWEAHDTPLHVEEFIVGSAAAHGTLALKAAHDVIPLEPDDPELPYDEDHSKSKTATELVKQEDGTYTSKVTLSLPSAQEELVTDVVFVLDKSTSATVEDQIISMLNSLNAQAQETNAKIKVGVVIFNKVANRVLELTDLSNMTAIENAVRTGISGGTNLNAGLLAGKAMLDEDTSVDANRKYLVLVSDGSTYYYCKGTDYNTPYTISSRNGGNAGNGGPGQATNNTLSAWDCKYSMDHVPTWSSYFGEVEQLLKTDYSKYEYVVDSDACPPDGAIDNDGSIPYEQKDNYPINVDVSLYNSYNLYREMQNSGYRCYSVSAGTSSSYPFGKSFMDYLRQGQDVSFDDIQKDIYYLLDKGSSVTDYMGYVADDYNFDFVNDANQLTMKVGEDTYGAVSLGENQYGFAPDSEGGYDYVLTYVQDDGKAGEHFVWTINVPVSNFAAVQLTYTVKLVNPKTAAGTYGEFDADGSEGYEDLYTNNSATLYPVDSNGDDGIPENFPKPTVSYTVGETPVAASLAISKAVTGNKTDQEFKFIVKLTQAADGTSPLTGAYDYTGSKKGRITLNENGQATVTLKHGETISINRIPVGTYYSVIEEPVTGYTPSCTGSDATGTVNSNQHQGQIVSESGGVVSYTNAYGTPSYTTNRVTVYYRELLTDNEVHESYIYIGEHDKAYDVTAWNQIIIPGYTYVHTEGDPLTGTLDSDKVIIVYYTSNDAAPDLAVTKELTEVNGRTYTGGRVDTGDDLTYTITVTNTGETVLENINVTDTLPSGLRLGSDDDSWTIDSLAPGATRRFTITATVRTSAEGELLNNRVTAQCGDLTVMDNETVRVDEDYTPTPTPDPDPDQPSRPDPDRPGDGDDTTDIADEEVPLAELPGLNKEDHFAYIIGYEDGTVRPEGYITRAEVATIFFRLMTDEYRETYWATSNLFTDVAQANWYNNGVSTTANVGWIAGYPDGTYRPNNNITRAEFATIAARFLSGDYNGENMFTDIDGHWAADYINRAAAIGWITGYAGQFRPDDYITRAEAVTLINRMLDRAPDADHMLENMIRWPDNPETAWYYEAIQEATNSHDYDRETIIDFETWTVLLENRDWAALEELWAQAADATGGEVADNLTPDVPADNN